MDRKKVALLILMFLPLAAALIFFPHLPNSIPAHYNAEGTMDRMGPKTETMIIPFVTILLGAIGMIIGSIAEKKGELEPENRNAYFISCIIVAVVMNILNAFQLYTAFTGTIQITGVRFDESIFLLYAVGIIFIAVGVILPWLKPNSIIGLRTKWSMKNEITWKKCQKFAAKVSASEGVFAIVLAVTAPGYVAFTVWLAVVFAGLLIEVYYSYRIAQKF